MAVYMTKKNPGFFSMLPQLIGTAVGGPTGAAIGSAGKVLANGGNLGQALAGGAMGYANANALTKNAVPESWGNNNFAQNIGWGSSPSEEDLRRKMMWGY